MSIREVAEHMGVTTERIRRELAISHIPARSKHVRPPRGSRAIATDEKIRQLYFDKGLNVVETASAIGISTEYLSKRLRQIGLKKRSGSFTPKAQVTGEMRGPAVKLYESGSSMRDVSQELGVSVSTVRKILHEAQVPVRRGGLHSETEQGRLLLDDLYADREVCRVLKRHGVTIPEVWVPSGPFEALVRLPIPAGLLKELYEDVGLSKYPIALLLGVGEGAVSGALRASGIDCRPRGALSPWMARRSAQG
jgi:transposase-like protein